MLQSSHTGVTARNPAGVGQSLHTSGAIDFNNPFFLQNGSNPRSCATCHSATQGWTFNDETAKKLFNRSEGLDPLFNLVDEGNRPDADISTLAARKAAFTTTVERAVTRFTASINPAAEFTMIAVADPYGWSTTASFSRFRQPTPTANETKVASILSTGVPNPDIITQLRGIGVGASRLHLQRDPLNPLPTAMAVAEGDFMFGVIFAQAVDNRAGRLDDDGAMGGAAHLMAQEWHLGTNDPASPTFNPRIFNIFDAWAKYDDRGHHGDDDGDDGDCGHREARARIYRGQEVFNGPGRCGNCHNSPNVGGHSFIRFFNIGTADPPNCGADLPLYTLQNKTTMEVKVTCDPGRALATGLWADIGRFRAPPLRGLAASSPYFHDGQAKDLSDVINHYNNRFTLNLTKKQKRDLKAFLNAL
jgi:hypothetical protein